MSSAAYFATVSDNQDPDSLHRVKITRTDEQETVTDWLPVSTPFAGNDTGSSSLPDVDDQVVVLSLDSANTQQVVVGSVWSNNAAPPQTGENSDADLNQDGKNGLRFVKSRAGNMLILDDTDGAEKIQLITSDGKSRFEFSVADELISLTTETDISVSAKGALTLEADEIDLTPTKQANIQAEEFQIKASKTLDISADKDITIKGSGIALN